MRVLSISIQNHSVRAAISEDDGLLYQYREFPWDCSSGFIQLMNILKTVLSSYSGYTHIGISTREMMSEKENKMLCANQIPGTNVLPLRAIITEYARLPVFLGSHIHASALGESVYGVGKPFDSVLYIEYGKQVNSSIVIKQEVYRGSHLGAGNFGHLTIHPDGLKCPCGNYGCYQEYASTEALVRRAKQVDERVNNGKEVFEAFEQGNLALKKVIHDWMDEVLRGMVNYIRLVDPQVILLSGGIFEEKYVFSYINSNLYATLHCKYQGLRLLRGELKHKAPLLGIAKMTTEKFMKKDVIE